MISRVVRADVHPVTIGCHSSMRLVRLPATRNSPRSARSARPIIRRKPSIWCGALVLKPTHPSAVRSIDGVSNPRGPVVGSTSTPGSMAWKTSMKFAAPTFVTSASERSTSAPGPPARRPRQSASATAAA